MSFFEANVIPKIAINISLFEDYVDLNKQIFLYTYIYKILQ